MLAPFGAAFLRRDPQAVGILRRDFRDVDARIDATRQAAQRRISPDLLHALHVQNQRLAPSPLRQTHLDLLGQPGPQGTAVVVTGQQVGLFLGPLYTIYKAATAIAAAKQLSDESGIPCVPLFWLQTEDHDFAEIDHCFVPIEGQPPLRLQLAPSDPSLARTSVAHRTLGPSVVPLIDRLQAELASLPHSSSLIAALRSSYRPDATLSDAFASFLGELFADEGLLVLDPRHPLSPQVARLALPLYRFALVEEQTISAMLTARADQLQRLGFSCQIPIRPDASLLFHHLRDVTGPRFRLERPAWSVPDSCHDKLRLSEADLLSLMDREPWRFSSSALLRPLIQDTLLPTAAYVGGPAELSYFAQLGPLYSLRQLPEPLVIPRARFRCVEDNTLSWLRKLNLQASDVEVPRAELIRKCLHTQNGKPHPDSLKASMLSDFGTRLDALEALDPALRDPVRRARDTINRSISHAIERYAHVLAERDVSTTQRIDRLQAFLFPNGAPQERVLSLPSFAAKWGLAAFKRALFASLGTDSACSDRQTVRELWL